MLFTSIPFKDYWVNKSLKNIKIYFYRKIHNIYAEMSRLSRLDNSSKLFYKQQKRLPISWKSQIAVGGGARIRTADTAGMNRML